MKWGDNITAIDYLTKFEQDKQHSYSKLTIASYVADVKQFHEFIGKDLEDVTNQDVDAFASFVLSKTNKHKGTPLKPQTVNKKLIALRRFIKWLNENTDIKIFTEIKVIKIQKQEYLSNDLLTIAEFERIIKAIRKTNDLQSKQAAALLYGLFYTGTRISELLQLKVSDIDKMNVWVKGKGSKYREIHITDKLKAVLLDYTRARRLGSDDFIFANLYNDKAMSRQSAHLIIKKYGGKAKVKLTHVHLHNIRHLFCLSLLDKGATIEEVADIAGHNDINTTRIYTRKSKDDLRKTVELL